MSDITVVCDSQLEEDKYYLCIYKSQNYTMYIKRLATQDPSAMEMILALDSAVNKSENVKKLFEWCI